MAKTIGNPISWAARNLGSTSDHMGEAISGLGGDAKAEMPMVQVLTMRDIPACLRAGYDDFIATRADAIFAIAIYPIAGLILFGMGMQMDLVPLLAPLVLGFALVGPAAAVGLYEISRRREAGQDAHWRHAFGVFRAPSFGSIFVLALYLTMLFLVWMMAAQSIYAATLGPEPPASIMGFVGDLFGTSQGWALIVAGNAVGLLFAVVALAISVVSFPLLLERKVGVPVAVVTSVRVLRQNPVVILSWGAMVAALLVLGSIPFMLGLIVVLPVLGHATWHLYRRAVA
ncbi:DUF2189 domain-containing protein [Ruegeria sp. 2012CJ41-6]|uniref:DUF2189 domain-containing protein n=1 Tax=Ruegeria spongiae TaxID=2942209 RepID=A0ABT0Q095_9RHOB|nr:DUF2189 domain-containing protein [Ruegeria spongiae]MCL6283284.1 DUF2189 domain-containing protein [Ruegeria spongiae]